MILREGDDEDNNGGGDIGDTGSDRDDNGNNNGGGNGSDERVNIDDILEHPGCTHTQDMTNKTR